jgi:WD40 repeat protein
VWSVDTHEEIMSGKMVHSGAIHEVAFSQDGLMILSSGEDSTLSYLNIETEEQEIFTTPDAFRCFRLLEENIIAGTSSGDVIVWSLAINAPVARKDGHTGPITCMDIATDGKIMVTGSEDRCVALWNLSIC